MQYFNKIREIRKYRGMTQAELADKAQLSLKTIRRAENGDTMPELFTLEHIAAALGVTLGELGYASGGEVACNDNTVAISMSAEDYAILWALIRKYFPH